MWLLNRRELQNRKEQMLTPRLMIRHLKIMTFFEQVDINTTGHADKSSGLVRTDKPSGLAKATDKSSTPVKAAGDKEDDIMITGICHTTPGNPVVLSKHSAKEELSAMGKGKWNTDLSS